MYIRTARLLLRRFATEDLEPLASILLHPDVVRWLGPLRRRARAREAGVRPKSDTSGGTISSLA